MFGRTFILRRSSCKGYFYACLILSSTTGIKQYEEIFGEIPSPPSEEKIQELSQLGIIGVKSEQ